MANGAAPIAAQSKGNGMDKRQAKRQARLLAARILEREVTHGRLILSIAEAESLSERDAKRLHDAYFEIVDKLYDTRIATPG